jgi:heavy metal sensor kinase
VNTKSIRFRLIAGYTGLITIVVLGFGIYTYLKVSGYFYMVLQQSLLRRATYITVMLRSDLDSAGEPAVMREIRARFNPEGNDRFIRISEKGSGVLYVSGAPNDASFDPKKVPPTDAWQSKTSTHVFDAGGHSKLLLVSLTEALSGRFYLIEVGTSEGDNDRVLQGLLTILLLGLPVVILVAVSGGSILLQGALRPVREMIETADEISHRELNARLPVPNTGDDLERLSITLNQMINRLEESFQNSRRFTSDASHELRTPLTIIRGELEQLLTRKDISDSIADRISSLMEETDRLIEITEALFALSRLDAGEALRENARADLGELAAATADQMSLLAEEKQIELTCIRHSPAEVKGDRSRLKQVIVNLLDNAIKYTPEGGKIGIEIRADKRHAYLEVIDTGLGIQEDDLPRIFDRFYRAESVRSVAIEGAGLGLSIVWSICYAHGGSVSANNTPGGGSRFTVRLPLASQRHPWNPSNEPIRNESPSCKEG